MDNMDNPRSNNEPVLRCHLKGDGLASYNLFITRNEYVGVLTHYVFVTSSAAQAMVDTQTQRCMFDAVDCVFAKDNDGDACFVRPGSVGDRAYESVRRAVPRSVMRMGGAVFFNDKPLGAEFTFVDDFGKMRERGECSSPVTACTHLNDMEWYAMTEGPDDGMFVCVCHVDEDPPHQPYKG